MARRSKRYKQQTVVRAILAGNVETLRDRRYNSLDTPTARNRALSKDADISFSQVQRILAGTVGAGVDILEAMAKVFSVRPQDLITPYFASQTSTPPEGSPADTGLHRRPKRA